MNRLSEQKFYFFGDLVSFTTCFGQLGHVQVINCVRNTWEEISNIKYGNFSNICFV